jgi:thiamine-phosphate pyrophosphorylase
MSRPQQTKSQASRLYLVTPAVEDAAAFAGELAAALAAADIAAVLLRLSASDERTKINRVKTLAPIAQDRGVALLLDGDAGLVARGGADGAHLSDIEAFLSAREILKPGRIAGCGGLASRHDAMTAAEQGADYVMLGDSRPAARAARDDSGAARSIPDAVLERVRWWSEVFEVPCVAVAASLDQVGPLAAAGADFVAVGDFIWSEPRGAAAALAAAAQALAAPEAVA